MGVTYNCPAVRSLAKVIYAIRHGESEGNARGLDDESLKNQPNHRFPLTEKGIGQISSTAQYIRDNKIVTPATGLYTSGFLRAQQSMEIVLAQQRGDFEVCIESRLDEWWKGIFHSLDKEEIGTNYPAEKAIQAREGWHHYRPPQGQAGKDVELNVLAFMANVKEEEIFIAGHGRTLGFLRRLLTNQPLDLNCKYPIPSNGELWKFEREGDYYKFKSLFTP